MMREIDAQPVPLRHAADIVRAARERCGLSLQQVAERVGCAKSYLWAIENDRRAMPGEELLRRLEAALGLDAGVLVGAASWTQTPASVKRTLSEMQSRARLARRLAELVSNMAKREVGEGPSHASPLDEAYRSGELHRLIEGITGTRPSGDEHGAGAGATSGDDVRVALPLEVPLINRVSAGYPTGFNDLGYPARVADEYVRCPDLDDADAFAVRVVGDSMAPEYREGDIVIFSPARDARDGSDCFARLGAEHETTIMRVYFEADPDGTEFVRLQPLNSRYPPRRVARGSVVGLYPAVSVMRRIG
ncbi:MAG: XRE family transcriptional regulator [Phycisphaerales bacterium]|nr:XRE family transcriptional regulator [Phycisphaerales bacterium]